MDGDPPRDPLREAALSFVRAGSWGEKQRVVVAHPELLDDPADAVLARLGAAQVDDAAREGVEMNRALLGRCRAVGVGLAFGEVIVEGILATGKVVPAALRDPLARALAAEDLATVAGDDAASNASVDAWQAFVRQPAFGGASRALRAAALDAWGRALRRRSAALDMATGLDTAITAHGQAVDVAPPDDAAALAAFLYNLGNALLERHRRADAPADLDAAISAYRRAVDTMPVGAPGRPTLLGSLGNRLTDRYRTTWTGQDLDDAIAAFEQAAQAIPIDAPGRPDNLSDLAGGHLERYVRTGDLADLEAAITGCREALQAIPADDPRRRAYLTNLGLCLRSRYAHTDDPADLREATAVSQEAVDGTGPDEPERVGRLNNLALCLHERFALEGTPDDLDQAIVSFREVLTAIPVGSPDWPGCLCNLGNGLHDRYRDTRVARDLDDAIAAFRQAVDVTPADATERPGFLRNLAGGLRDRYERGRSPADLEAAAAAYRQACRLGLTVEPGVALGAAQVWGGWASERRAWGEAAEAYGHALDAIDRLYLTQPLPGARQTWLRDAQGLAGCAAYAFAQAGDLAGAVLALERGRARVLTEALQRDRADLTDIRVADPDGLAAYERASGRLRQLESQERATRTTRPDGPGRIPPGVLQAQAREARAQLEAATTRIRRLPGHDAFGQPPTFDEIARAVQPGWPLAALMTTPVGSLVLLVHRSERSAAPITEALWAPDMNGERLLSVLLETRGDEVVGGYLLGQRDDPDCLDAALAEGLPRLGASLIAPVAARLRALDATGVVLMPTGLLGLLPLHAATYPVDGRTCCLLDEFDVTYTPGARVLARARAAVASLDRQPPVLVGVGDPRPETHPLMFARGELEEIVRFFPAGARHPLYGAAATEPDFVALLPGATHVHLACHGVFDVEAPLDSCLELAPGPDASDGDQGLLRLQEILDHGHDWLGHARLVVLSACQTAITDVRSLPDEAIGLPAGLLQAGVPGVIGTLWSVDDLSTTLLMTKLYAYLRQGDPATGEGPLSPAAALRRAQCWLRAVTVDELMALFAVRRPVAPPTGGRAAGERLSTAQASAAVRRYGWEDSARQPFAAPYYWAPFVAIGV